MTIKWTAATRKQLHGFRTTHKTDPAPRSYGVVDGWAALRRLDAARPATWRADAHFTGTLERLTREAAVESPPSFEPAIELARAAWILHRNKTRDFVKWDDWEDARALIGLWSAGGMEATLKLLLTPEISVRTVMQFRTIGTQESLLATLEAEHGYTPVDPSMPRPGIPFSLRPTAGLNVDQDSLWAALRCFVSDLSEADFASANAVAHRVRNALPEADAWGRAAIAYAFFRDGSHAAEEAARAEAGGGHDARTAQRLLVALADARQAERLYERYLQQSVLSVVACDLVESFGPEARGLLEKALSFAENKFYAQPKLIKGALKLVS